MTFHGVTTPYAEGLVSALKARGMKAEIGHTGGNCWAVVVTLETHGADYAHEILVTDADASLPVHGDEVWVGEYVDGDTEHDAHFPDGVDLLQLATAIRAYVEHDAPLHGWYWRDDIADMWCPVCEMVSDYCGEMGA